MILKKRARLLAEKICIKYDLNFDDLDGLVEMIEEWEDETPEPPPRPPDMAAINSTAHEGEKAYLMARLAMLQPRGTIN